MRKTALKAKIKGHIETVRCLKRVKSKVKTSSWDGRFEEMTTLHFERFCERVQGRYLHLAYGYLKDIPYSSMEKTTRAGVVEKWHMVKYTAQWAGANEAEIEAWMAGRSASGLGKDTARMAS